MYSIVSQNQMMEYKHNEYMTNNASLSDERKEVYLFHQLSSAFNVNIY